LNGEVQSF